MRIAFHGAARNVTGSCHLIECRGTRILIDCGLYQGNREMDEENRNDFGFDPASIDYLLLTHGHLDHCGRIPLLSRLGFKGTILTTSATRELARLVLLDSARIQEEEARYRNYKASKRRDRGAPAEPLYDTLDALNSLDAFVDIASFAQPHDLCPGIRTTFYDAGHILGSACILLELEEGGRQRRVLFSGDLGCDGRAILPDPAPPPQADTVIMESTYGDRLHKQLGPSIEELYQAINTTVARDGNVLIPSFALERTQELLYYLREGIEQQRLPRHLRVCLDSPMAISATQIFRRHRECFDEETWAVVAAGRDPFELPGLEIIRDASESMALKHSRGAVIIAGSGMCTGGRIRHHLRHNLWRREASVVFVGYAAGGTLARQIIEGAEVVRVLQEEVEVNAEIYTIGGFSAHADQRELCKWHGRTGSPERTFLVHGEEKAMQALAGRLTGTTVEMPRLHESFEL
ncbi:MBL fold metallo-hydrolase RNA specificity domain-containing protein [Desulfobulbus elongatus]|uniref:MBL fold metallo-hydrolase RNA specificity domain-containing protein n=1 Tax=Desulfobulbus elongatus TaxID=53332 RepID=UPI0004850601|nr:MBL fold metallo-hydrolase [Desulfobulbus elongatus]